MATCNVNVLCPNGRRQKVKVSPQMTLIQLIQEVCKKQKLNPNNCSIRHQMKILDSSLTVRFANLPNNAHLELIESAEEQVHTAKKCVVALQLESGDRLVHEFNSDDSLFKILQHWKSQSERQGWSWYENTNAIYDFFLLSEVNTISVPPIDTPPYYSILKSQNVSLAMTFLPPHCKINKYTLALLMSFQLLEQTLTFDDSAVGVVCIYANQEVKGLEKLKSTTLSMVGLNGGRGVIRLIQPSTTKSGKDESVVMEAVFEKPSLQVQATTTETIAAPSVVVKSSTEDIEMASRTASSVSMTSQGSDDCSMQCTELIPASIPVPEKSDAPEGKPSNTSRENKKAGKGHEEGSAMDVEPCGPVQVDVGKAAPDADLPALPSGASGTCGSVATVQVFSGVGRTLGSTEPDVKKARFHSPPRNEKSRDYSEEDTKALFKDNENNVGQLGRQTVAFRLGDGVSISSDDISDDFFEVTVNDLRLMLKDLQSERIVEEPLTTRSMKELQEKSKMDKYERVAIRVYFPDRSVLQGFFSPREQVSAVTQFVKENLQQKNYTNFYLYTTPPRTLLDKPNMTLCEAKLVPAAVIHFGSRETQECYLNSNIVQQMTNMTDANEKVGKHHSASSSTVLSNDATMVAVEKEDASKTDNETKPETAGGDTSNASEPKISSSDSVENSRRNVDKAVPKWFKLGK